MTGVLEERRDMKQARRTGEWTVDCRKHSELFLLLGYLEILLYV